MSACIEEKLFPSITSPLPSVRFGRMGLIGLTAMVFPGHSPSQLNAGYLITGKYTKSALLSVVSTMFTLTFSQQTLSLQQEFKKKGASSANMGLTPHLPPPATADQRPLPEATLRLPPRSKRKRPSDALQDVAKATKKKRDHQPI